MQAPDPGSTAAVVPAAKPFAFAADPFTDGKDVDTPTQAQLGPAFKTPCTHNNDPSDVNADTQWFVMLFNGFEAPVTVTLHGVGGAGSPTSDTTLVDNNTTWLSASRPVYVAGPTLTMNIDSVQYTIHAAPTSVRMTDTVVWAQALSRERNVILVQMYVYEYRPALYFMAEVLVKALSSTYQTCTPVIGPTSMQNVPSANAHGAFVGMYNYTQAAVPYTMGLYDASMPVNQVASAYVLLRDTLTLSGAFTVNGAAVTVTADMSKLQPPQTMGAVARNGVAVVWFPDVDTRAGGAYRVLFVVYGDDRAQRYVNLVLAQGFTPPRSAVPVVIPKYTLSVMSLVPNAAVAVQYTPPDVSGGIATPGQHSVHGTTHSNTVFTSSPFTVTDVTAVPCQVTVGSNTFKGSVNVCTAGTVVERLSSTSGGDGMCAYLAVNAANAVLAVFPPRVNPLTLCTKTPNDVTCAWFSALPTHAKTTIPAPAPAKTYTVSLRVTSAWTVPPCGTPVPAPKGTVAVSSSVFNDALHVAWDAGVNAASGAQVQLYQGVPVTVRAALPSGEATAVTFTPGASSRQAFQNDAGTMVVTQADDLLQVFVLGGPGAGSGVLAQDIYNAVSTTAHGNVSLLQLRVSALNNTTSSSLTAGVFGCASQPLTAQGAAFAATAVVGAPVSALVQGSLIPTLTCASSGAVGLRAPPSGPPPPLSCTLGNTPSQAVQGTAALLLPGTSVNVAKPGASFPIAAAGYLVVRATPDLAAQTAAAWLKSPTAPSLPPPVPSKRAVRVTAYNEDLTLPSFTVRVGTGTVAVASVPSVTATGSSATVQCAVGECVRVFVGGGGTPTWTADLRTDAQYTSVVAGTLVTSSWPRAGHAAVVLAATTSATAAAGYKAALDAAWTAGAPDPPHPTAPTPVPAAVQFVNASGKMSSVAYSVDGGPATLVAVPRDAGVVQRTATLPAARIGTVRVSSGVNAGAVAYTATMHAGVDATVLADGVTVGATWPRVGHEAVVVYAAPTAAHATTYAQRVTAQWAAGAARVPTPPQPSPGPPPSPSPPGGTRASGALSKTWQRGTVYGSAVVVGAVGLAMLIGGLRRSV